MGSCGGVGECGVCEGGVIRKFASDGVGERRASDDGFWCDVCVDDGGCC